MKVQLVFFIACIQRAFLTQTVSLFDQHRSCLSNGSPNVILSSNGADSSASLSMLQLDNGYLPGSNCSITFQASENQLLLLTFDTIDTRPCKQDSITVLTPSSNGTHSPLCGDEKCPADNCPKYTFADSSKTVVQFLSANDSFQVVRKAGFHATVTAYYQLQGGSKDNCPGDERFRCANNRCIWEGFHCDGHNHCGDNSDEPPGCAKTVWGVLVIILGVVAVCFFLPLFCYLAVWGPRRKVPVRIMGGTFFGNKEKSTINNEESVPILSDQLVQGTFPGETYTFYYGAASTSNPRC